MTINNAERGLLLLRIRDEIRMTLAAHVRLFEAGFAYGTRKANLVEDDYQDLHVAIEELRKQKGALENQIQEISIAIYQTERKHSEAREVSDKRAADEIQFLKRANHQLRVSSKIETNSNVTSKLSFISQEQLEGIQGIKKTGN